MKKNYLFLMFVIFLFAYFLRVMYLPKLALTFGYDQARDAYWSSEIASGHLKVLGPPASTPGLYHGVFYYYVLAPAYLLGHGSPIVAAAWIALLNAGTVFIIFYFTYLLTKKPLAGLLSALVFAVSFEASQYAVWLSNPTIAVWTVPLIYLGLWLWFKDKKSYGPVLVGFGLGLSIQAEVFLLYHTIPLLIWLWFNRNLLKRRDLSVFFIFLAGSVSTMILAEFKFGFRSVRAIPQLFNSSDPIGFAGKSFADYLNLYLNQLGRVFAYNIYPGNVGLGALLIFIFIGWAYFTWDKKTFSWQPLLISWLLAHAFVVSVGGVSTPFLLVGMASGISILSGIAIYNIWMSSAKWLAVGIVGLIVFGNISMIIRENPKGQTIFSIQKDMTLARQLPAIDYTYESSGGQSFSINTVTSPLWINIVWTYLYKWHGQPKYGYLPSWHGRDQVGQIDTLENDKGTITKDFLIIEPMDGIPPRYLSDTVGSEDVVSTLVDEKYFGTIRVQNRISTNKNERILK